MARIKNARELATILHGLRMIQCEGRIEGCAAGDCEHFEDVPALTNEEIDALCERLNAKTSWQRYEEALESVAPDGKASCRKCGKAIPPYGAFLNYGTGPEEGNTFTYCSAECRRAH